MSRSIPATVYLIHFAQPFKHAKHYIGFTAAESVDARVERHRSGRGARLLRAVVRAGIDFSVVREWAFKNVGQAREFERRLKKRAATRNCPVCSGRSQKEGHVKIQARYGEWFDEVLVDGKLLDPKPSQKVRNHSPDGFAWGYAGSGPAQLALAICLASGLPTERAQRHYQDFKRQFIERQPQRGDWELEIDVVAWAERQEAERPHTRL